MLQTFNSCYLLLWLIRFSVQLVSIVRHGKVLTEIWHGVEMEGTDGNDWLGRGGKTRFGWGVSDVRSHVHFAETMAIMFNPAGEGFSCAIRFLLKRSRHIT